MNNLESWGLQKHYNNYPILILAVFKARNDSLTIKWSFIFFAFYNWEINDKFTKHKARSWTHPS